MFGCLPKPRKAPKPKAAPRSAQKLWQPGIRFRPSDTGFLDDIDFHSGRRRLKMPRVVLDDSSEYKYRNAMAFEALHAGTGGNDVTAFVLFMRDLIDSAADVEMLCKKRVLVHDLAGSDWAVVRLFNRLTKDMAKFGGSRLCVIRQDVDYCDKNWHVFAFESWAKFKSSHLSSPWAFIALLFTLLLIGTDITQTVFSVNSYAHEIAKDRQERQQHS